MNKIKTFLLLAITYNAGIPAFAQQLIPAPYTSQTKVNYVRTWDAVKPDTADNTFFIYAEPTVAKITTQYLDGLGRPLQTVVKKGSLVTGGTAVDMVNPVLYDEMGRIQLQYLPFAANNAGSNSSITDGLFKINPFQQDSVFNRAQFPDENWIYGKTDFEASPLGKVNKTFSAGNSWVGSNRGIEVREWFNTSVDSIRIWNVTDVTNDFGTYSSSAFYSAGQLLKAATLDEHGKEVVEFKDREGLLIMKKVQLTASADTGIGKGPYGWLCTYYIYDILGQLRCVVQPKGTELLIANSYSFNSTILDEQSFRYEYDKRGRMIMKKVPGAGTAYMVYDAADRLVMTQNALLQSAHQWEFTQYDGLNRAILTGLITDNTNYNNAGYHRGQAESSTSYPNVGGYTNEELTRTFYDNYDWLASNGNPFPASRNTSFDDHLMTPSNTTYPYPQAVTQSFQTSGMVTGTRIKVLGTSQYLYGINYYDDRGRTIQTYNYNITGWADMVTNQYDFLGKILRQTSYNTKNLSTPKVEFILTDYNYDDLQRLASIVKQPYTYTNNWYGGIFLEIARNEYDALGQLKTKKLEPSYNSNAGLETQNFEYNIRGWMLGANRSYVKDTTSTANWFGFDLGYDKTSFTVNGNSKSYAAAQYNGNIGGMLWKSTGDDQLRKYDFAYDAMNRLTGADFNQLTANNFSKTAGIDFSVAGLNYDANGNILNMNQQGWKLGGSATIDSLLYTYTSGTNKLLNVLDRRNDTATLMGDFRSSKAYMTALGNNKTTAVTDYTYDGNGNLTLDKNKDIAFIHYNHLNLPDSIAVTGKGYIKYVYDATGNKLKKVTNETGGPTTTTLYCSGTIYRNDSLQFISMEEGRMRFRTSDNTFQFDYFLKDHLGNVRMMLTNEQQTDAYPVASLEATPLATERAIYSGVDTGRIDKSLVSGYPTDTYTNPNNYIQKLGTNGLKIGTGIVLKVMAGDKFNLRVNSWWNSGSTPATPVDPLNNLIGILNNNIGAVASSHGNTTQLLNTNALSSPITSFLNTHSTYTSSRPKAFVNWILFDEQFRFVSSSSGFEQVEASNTFKTHLQNGLPINKSGYLYVYVSNETPNIDVFFDNLQVTHIRGPLLEETHYYPFGLEMKGISSRAISFGDPQNLMKKFQGQEFNPDMELNFNEFKWRTYNPQICRFIQIDPLSDKYAYNSTYAFSENKVTSHVELEGLEASPMGYLQRGFEQIGVALASGADKISGFFTRSKTETSSPSSYTNAKTVVTVDSKTEHGTNFLGWLLHSKNADATVNNGPSLWKAETTTQVKIELKQELQTNQATITTKTALDGSSQEIKVEKSFDIRKVPVTFSVANSQNFQTGENKTSIQGGIESNGTGAFGLTEIVRKDGKVQSTSVSMGVEQKTGNTKNSFSIGKTF
jgi:RHS repeat-associated protein